VLVPTETETRKFKFSLRKNEMLLADGEGGERILFRVQKLSEGELQLCPHNVVTIQGTDRNRWNQITNVERLRERNATKVNPDPAGQIGPDSP
jgi:CRISPR-associated endonuclease Csn1